MNQKTISLAIGVVAVLAVVAFAAFGDLKGLEQIRGGADSAAAVALVNGEEISGTEFDTRITQTETLLTQQGQSAQLQDPTIRSQMEQQILDQMITETLLLQKADEAGITATSEEVDAQVSTLVEQVGGEAAFRAELERQDLEEAQLRSDIEDQVVMQKYLEANVDISSIEVTDEEVSAFYEQISAQQEGVPPLEEIETQIRAQLTQQEQAQLVNTFTQELRSEAEIEVLL